MGRNKSIVQPIQSKEMKNKQETKEHHLSNKITVLCSREWSKFSDTLYIDW